MTFGKAKKKLCFIVWFLKNRLLWDGFFNAARK